MAELTMSERVQAPTGTCPARLRPLPSRFVTWVAVTILAAMAFTWELETSALQARLLAGIATQAGWKVDPGPSDHIHFPASGPHDERLGYTHIPDFVSRLTGAGYEVESQARFSRWLERLTDAGLFPLYREKVQAGLRILGDDGRPLYASRFPRRVYADFDAIPRVLVDSLLFVENRELLDPRFPKRNPAVDWSRFGHGLFTLVADAIGHGDDVAGGSTLTTQMEKYRHSRGGLTATPVEKLRQIVSASLRAYRSGEITAPARRQIVADYFNTVPLAAAPGHGEVIGLPEGLEVWYGRDYHELAEVLGPGPRVRSEDPDALEERALAYKQALSLLLAVQRPSRFLVEHPEALERRTDAYLPLLASQGVISPELAELGRVQPLVLGGTHRTPSTPASKAKSFDLRKGVAPARARLVAELGLPDLYALDRLDLTLETSLDETVRAGVLERLHALGDPDGPVVDHLRRAGLLHGGDPTKIVYGFALYERGDVANRLLVQADTLDQPLVVNDGVMLDLGSTAKLRTLATYLEIVASLHDRLAGRSADELRALVASPQVHEHDALTRWVVDRLIARPATTRGELVEAALERRYSASPSERFHTGGGLHRFHNFDPEQNSLHPTVRAAFRDSVNLAFVRIMRDIVYHRMYFDPGVAGQVLADRSHPLRAEYLKTFADREGTRYLDRFYRRYHGKSPDGMLATLLDHTRLTPKRLAMIERATAPELGFDAYQENLAKRLPKWDRDLSAKTIREVYDTYDPARYGLNDQAYLSGTHPLELWLVAYLHENPEATLDEVIAASATARQTAYRWLFRTQHKAVQDARIKTLLEAEAFKTIHSEWQRTGYPFDALVPSYGSALGSSGDRPSALAELMGIILNDGIRRPVQVVERVRFAEGTPYETTLVHAPRDGERVLHSEVAAALREALREPVEHGTGRRANGVLVDRNGRPLVVGGKTGTGDNVSKRFNAEGETIDERVLSRAAAFAFYIHDRYYGVITAYVPGANAADYGFTSSLTTEIFRMLAPVLEPLVERSSEPEPDPGPALVVQAPAVDRASGQCVVARAPVEVPAAEDRSVEAGPADAPTWPSDEGAIVAVPASRSAVAGSLPMDLPLTTGSDPRA